MQCCLSMSSSPVASGGSGIKIAVIVLLVIVIAGVVYSLTRSSSNKDSQSATSAPDASVNTPSGGKAQSAPSAGGAASAEAAFQPKAFDPVTDLKSQDLKVGTGDEAESGKQVTVHYTGWLSNGQKFDSSKDRGQPFQFRLGSGMVIQGWDKGVAGMKVGGVRRLTIPPQMAYGERGAPGAIPMNASLQFDVELLKVD